MIFKRLSEEDLKQLEKEFVDFLVLNGITADDWVKLKEEKPQNASAMIDSFSDAMYAGMMRKVKYLEHITPTEIMCFYCQPEQIVLAGIETTDASIDFTTSDVKELIQHSQDLQVYTTTKKYVKPREVEVFELMEKGATLSDGTLFTSICAAL